MSGREREPLAFRVKPLPGECFESWLRRLAERHETTRKALFRHLGIETALADCDLASSADWDPERRIAMVGRLAWATMVPEKAIFRTFVGCARADLLPPALRSLGCAQCLLDWLASGAPWRIERGWILRVATRCERHELLLTDLREVMGLGRTAAARRLLEGIADRTREQMARFTLVKTRLAWNLVVSRAHTRGNRLNSWAFSARYLAALVGNRFHYAPSRHLLLAALHSNDVAGAERMERIFRFEAQPVRNLPMRRPRGAAPKLSDLAVAIGNLGERQLGRKRAQLEAAWQNLEQARQNYPFVHSAHLLRSQRAALTREVRSRYAAEIAGAVTPPLACLRGFQDALFYLKQCGMADDVLTTALERPDPWEADSWEDCLEDAGLLRERLGRRFAHPEFRIVLDLPGHSFGIDAFERDSRRSISAIAASNSARPMAESAGDSGRERLSGGGLPLGETARIRT
jgi:TniQ